MSDDEQRVWDMLQEAIDEARRMAGEVERLHMTAGSSCGRRELALVRTKLDEAMHWCDAGEDARR